MRKRRSRYDPYRDLISDWCGKGMTVSTMADILTEETGEEFFEQGIYAYIYRHNLRFRPWKDVYDARNQCDSCEYCHKYTNTINTEGRICCLSWKTIQKNVFHSPVWCEKERDQ